MVCIKEEARHLVETLPDGATWEDLMERIYVRKTIEAGLADADSGRTVALEEVRKRYDLEP